MDKPGFTNRQIKDSFLQLLFLINPTTKEIRFSNQPLASENSNYLSDIPSSFIFINGIPGRDVAEWEECLLLKPDQSRQFNSLMKTETGELTEVLVNALGVQLTGEAAGCILFTIDRQRPADAEKSSNQNEQVTALIEGYKNEYISFIDIAAHDLDAPLRKLSAFIDRLTIKLAANARYEEVQDYITRIEICLKDMRSMIDDLAVLSRINTHSSPFDTCDLESILQKIIEEMSPLLNEKKAVLHIAPLPAIPGNADQLKILFRNLIENSIKFSKKKISSVINIRSFDLSPEEKTHFNLPGMKQYCRLEIDDNGIGFKQEYAERIFKPFQRLHGKSQFTGNGIGLAVCKKIIDNHHGIIYAKGDEDSGACFVLILPQTSPETC